MSVETYPLALIHRWARRVSSWFAPRRQSRRSVGGPLIFVSAIFVLFGVYEQDGVHALLSLPEAAFEARSRST
jgi:hypothetical protein